MSKFLSFIIVAALLTGCLNDKKYMDLANVGPVIEFPLGGPGVKQNDYSVGDFTKDVDTSIALNIASPQVLDRDVQVTVRLAPAVVSEYNDKNGTSYAPIPNSNFVIDNYTVTIPKGHRIGSLKIKLLFSKFTLKDQFALGLQIVDAPGLTISGNYGKFLWTFNLRNKWDGYYRLYGGFSRSDQPTYTGVSNSPQGYFQYYQLITASASSVEAAINTQAYGIVSTQIVYVNDPTNPAYTYFTGVGPKLNIDANNNVTVLQGKSATQPSVPFIQDNAELAASKYYPTGIPNVDKTDGKKTIVAHFRWSSGGVDRITKDTFVYIQPR